MKKQMYFIAACATSALVLLGSCRGQQQVSESYSYTSFPTTLVNANPSGELTLRVWGSGPNKSQAIENAMRNAVSDVIFKGVRGGNGAAAYVNQPLIYEVNARERYREYFDLFFADGGEWRKFVTETSASDKSRVKSKSKGRENFGVTVNIDRNALERQLRADGLIN